MEIEYSADEGSSFSFEDDMNVSETVEITPESWSPVEDTPVGETPFEDTPVEDTPPDSQRDKKKVLTGSVEGCTFTTVWPQNLRRHTASEHDGKRYECTVCKKSYANKFNLDQHTRFSLLHV